MRDRNHSCLRQGLLGPNAELTGSVRSNGEVEYMICPTCIYLSYDGTWCAKIATDEVEGVQWCKWFRRDKKKCPPGRLRGEGWEGKVG